MKCKAGRQEKQLIKTELPHGLKAGTNNGRRKKRRGKMRGCNKVGKKAWLGQEQNQEILRSIVKDKERWEL